MSIRKSFIAFTAALVATIQILAQPSFQIQPSADLLRQHVSYLASDALDGRRTGTTGANDAANYISVQFSRLGLKPANRTAPRVASQATSPYLQAFPYVAAVELGTSNGIKFSRHSTQQVRQLSLKTDWMPLGFSSKGSVNGPMEFAGFGITAAELNYDDYAGVNAKDKIVVVLSGTPDGDNPHNRLGRYEDVRWKAIAARNAGAKALLVVAREANFNEDRLATLRYDHGGEAGLPVAVISRQSVDELLGTPNLSELERIAKAKTQSSLQPIGGQFTISIDVVRREVPAYNVIGVLEGSDPILRNETIIIGAHYDHLGRGGQGSLAQKGGQIHHGADDNASGTAGVLELARIFTTAPIKSKRTIAFMAFGGEEEGLLGSNYYVNHPLLPLANTVAMINMDMIGRMKDSKLVIGGVGTAKEWREILDGANIGLTLSINTPGDGRRPTGMPIVVSTNGETVVTLDPTKSFSLTLQEDGYGPSDHASFYSKQIPVLFFWTGTHNDYHKPSDTFDKINYEDEARILIMVAKVVRRIDSANSRPTYTVAKSDSTARTGGFRVYLGTIPNYGESNDGMLLDGVRDDSPAAKAGLKAGDKIVKIGNREVKNVYEYTYALGEMKAGQEYVIEVMRGGERLAFKITPEARK
jgi:Zn-dependent M28 family amino/carboxypeptidase